MYIAIRETLLRFNPACFFLEFMASLILFCKGLDFQWREKLYKK